MSAREICEEEEEEEQLTTTTTTKLVEKRRRRTVMSQVCDSNAVALLKFRRQRQRQKSSETECSDIKQLTGQLKSSSNKCDGKANRVCVENKQVKKQNKKQKHREKSNHRDAQTAKIETEEGQISYAR